MLAYESLYVRDDYLDQVLHDSLARKSNENDLVYAQILRSSSLNR